MICPEDYDTDLDDELLEGDDVTRVRMREVALHADSGWLLSLIAAAIGFMVPVLVVPYPQVLPFGLVLSPASLLSLMASFVQAAAAGLIARLLCGRVPMILSVLSCGLLPVACSVSILAFDMWAYAFVVGLSLVVGVVCWLVRRRVGRRGVLVPSCVATAVWALGLVALMSVGTHAFAERPDLFACGYAQSSDNVGHGARADLAESLVSAIGAMESDRELAGVVVTPFCADWEGRFMSWGANPDGRRVLLVASEYVASYTEGELVNMACGMMGEDDSTATLYTRWLDGRIYLWTLGVCE